MDGIATGSPLVSACGGIFWDNKAAHLGSFMEFLGNGNAEFCVVLITIEKVIELGWKKVWIESDCILVVNSFYNHNLVPWNLKARWRNCWIYTLSINFLITHIFREANFRVDILAGLGLKLRRFSWFSFVHRDVLRKFLLDKEGTPRLIFQF